MQFKDYLRAKRREKAIPLRTFAMQIGISPSFLCDLESGHRSFPSDKELASSLFLKMVKALGLNPTEEAEFKTLADQSTLEGGKLSSDIREYLMATPQAQLALRKAKEKGLTDKMWLALIEKIEGEQ